MRRAHRCRDIPQVPAVFVEVTRPPKVQGQDVWPVAPSSMWQAEHAAVMCRALQGQAAALPRAPAAQSSSNKSAAQLALLHSGSRMWCWVVVVLEPHSSALRLYDCGEDTVLTVPPADLEALHLGALSGDGGTVLYHQGTVLGSAAVRFRQQSGGDALCRVMAENMWPWLQAFSTSRWKVVAPLGGGAVSSRGGFCTCRNNKACHRFCLRHPWLSRRSGFRRQRSSCHRRRAPHLSTAAIPTFDTYCSTLAANWPRSSVV